MAYAAFALKTFANMLGTLDHLAGKAQAAGLSDDLLNRKLAEDMFPLELQFRVALNQVLLAFNQVGGEAAPLEETAYGSFAEVRERIAAVRARVDQADPKDWAQPDAVVDLTLPNRMRFVMSAETDIRDWILPNFYFHVTMAYALLRHAGLEIGKIDYLGHMSGHMAKPEA